MSRALHDLARGLHAHRTEAAQSRLNAELTRSVICRVWHRFMAAHHQAEARRCAEWLEALQ